MEIFKYSSINQLQYRKFKLTKTIKNTQRKIINDYTLNYLLMQFFYTLLGL